MCLYFSENKLSGKLKLKLTEKNTGRENIHGDEAKAEETKNQGPSDCCLSN